MAKTTMMTTGDAPSDLGLLYGHITRFELGCIIGAVMWYQTLQRRKG
jgi:hypothetical protein